MISKQRSQTILSNCAGKRVLVVGDMMLDRYVSGSVTRISPEAPVPVLLVENERSVPGGAANVALNIQSLGGQAIVCGLVGDDPAGGQIRDALESDGIVVDGLVCVAGLQTTVKTRVVAERQQIARVDRENRGAIEQTAVDELCRRVEELGEKVDGIIIEDYAKGVVSQACVDCILKVAKKRDLVVGFDPTFNQKLSVQGITLATPNYAEAIAAAGLTTTPGKTDGHCNVQLAEASRILAGAWEPDLLLITLGPGGMYVRSRDGRTRTIPTLAREVYDVSGAGDTVIAAAVLGLLGGATHDEAASLANRAAGVVVGRIGAATCSVVDLLSGEDDS